MKGRGNMPREARAAGAAPTATAKTRPMAMERGAIEGIITL